MQAQEACEGLPAAPKSASAPEAVKSGEGEKLRVDEEALKAVVERYMDFRYAIESLSLTEEDVRVAVLEHARQALAVNEKCRNCGYSTWVAGQFSFRARRCVLDLDGQRCQAQRPIVAEWEGKLKVKVGV
jgi:hypothetical protein